MTDASLNSLALFQLELRKAIETLRDPTQIRDALLARDDLSDWHSTVSAMDLKMLGVAIEANRKYFGKRERI